MWWTATATVSCGQSEAPIAENGQSPTIRPSGPCIIVLKLKKATDRNDARTSAVMICLRNNFIACYSLARFKSTALNATMTVETDINAAANAGCKIIPFEANTPAANGKAMTLYPVAQKRFWIILR